MPDLAVLNITINSDSAVKATKDLDALDASGKRVEQSSNKLKETTDNVGKSFVNLAGTYIKSAASLVQMGASYVTFKNVAVTALGAVEVAAEATWGAVTGGLSLIWSLFRGLAGFLNPFTLKGIIAGAVTGAAGVGVKEVLDAADAVEVFRSRLGALIGDQKIANTLYDGFEELSTKIGISAEQLSGIYSRLFELGVRDTARATETVAGVAAYLHKDIEEFQAVLSNPNPRGLKKFGIDLNEVAGQYELVSGNIRVTTLKTEEALRAGLIDVLGKKFPDAVEKAGQSLSVKFAIFHNALGQYAQDFGAILLPAAKNALDAVNKFLKDHQDQIVAFVRVVPQLLAKAWDLALALFSTNTAGDVLLPVFTSVLKSLGTLVVDMVQIVVASLSLLAEPVKLFFKTLFEGLVELMTAVLANLVPRAGNALVDGILGSDEQQRHDTAKATYINDVRGLHYSDKDTPQGIQAVKDFEEQWEKGKREYLAAHPEAANAGQVFAVTPTNKIFDEFGNQLNQNLKTFGDNLKTKTPELVDLMKQLGTDLKNGFGDLGDTTGTAIGKLPKKEFQDLIDVYTKSLDELNKAKNNPATHSNAAPEQILPLTDPSFAEQTTALGGDSYQANLARNLAAYKKAIVEARTATSGTQDGADLFAQRMDALNEQLIRQDTEALHKQEDIENQLAIVLSTGREKNLALAKAANDRELANWERLYQSKTITAEQFAAIQKELSVPRAQRELEERTKNIQFEISLLGQGAEQTAVLREERALETAGIDKGTEAYKKYIEEFKHFQQEQKKEAEIAKVAHQIGDAFGSAFEGIIDGTRSVSQAFKQMAMEIEKAILESLVIRPIAEGVSQATSSLIHSSSALAGLFGGAATASAMGNVFSGGSLVPFANGGIFDTPTQFPMAGGRTGVMGEAGPEAVMPLTRDGSGRLGVKSSGGGPPSVTVNVFANDADSFRKSETQIQGALKRALR